MAGAAAGQVFSQVRKVADLEPCCLEPTQTLNCFTDFILVVLTQLLP